MKHKKAAEFIRSELKKNNVSLLGEDGFQSVPLKVNNILEANLYVGFKGRKLELGKEFLVLGYYGVKIEFKLLHRNN